MFNGNCITCHKETQTISAPSVVKFKEVYKNAFPEKEEFINYMSTWVFNPKAESSLMQDSIQKHGLMPHLSYDIDTLKEISAYIYETDFTTRGGKYWSK
ncbi:cytochrome C [Candidatus Sulfurimonas baltica]|uniref:Cytochrome C n=1 Tax=Candidatus Sulfurimonas baltica TaxID=2740404 RepID=A0A7S7LY36_9BACT|nr:cytochrome C [Candidatus Sulfurimonas baltica]